MIPLKQRFKHDPANGVWGDCHRAAMASIFHLSLDDVPHFGDGGGTAEEFELRVNAWLDTRGIKCVGIPFNCAMDEVLTMMSKQAAGIYYLFAGTSRTGCNHTVVACGGEIVHDPSLTDAGIVASCDDGFYWVEFLVHKNLGAA